MTAHLRLYLFLLVIAFFAVFPVIYILASSFKTNKEILVGGTSVFPKVWQWKNYEEAWYLANFGQLTANSILYAAVIVVGCILTSITAGYVFARGKTRFGRFMYAMVLGSLFVSIGTLSLYPQLQLAKAFGKSTFVGVLMAIPGIKEISRLILGVSKAKYQRLAS